MDAFPGQPARYSTDPAADGDNRSARRRSQAKRWAVEVGFAAVLGGLALVDPNRLTPGKRAVYRLSEAAVAAAMTGWSMRGSGWPARAMTPGFAAGAAGLSLGLAELSERLDARIVGALDRRGVSNPRAVIAAVTVGTQLLSALSPAQDDTEDDAHIFGDDLDAQPVPENIREIVSALLSADNTIDGGALAEQLDGAAAFIEGDSGDTDDQNWVQFEVDPGSRRSPLASYTHPARLEVRELLGQKLVVSVRVEAGRLESVHLERETRDMSEETEHDTAEATSSVAYDASYVSLRDAGEALADADESPRWSELDLDRAQIVIGHGEGERRQDYRSRS